MSEEALRQGGLAQVAGGRAGGGSVEVRSERGQAGIQDFQGAFENLSREGLWSDLNFNRLPLAAL